jgi:hypothetical protein
LAGRLQAEVFLRPREEHGNVASKGRDRRHVAAVRLQHIIAAVDLSRTEGAVWGLAAASVTPNNDPHRQPDLGSIAA